MGPLSGLKVIELAALGPVPFCGMLLGDMGADVVRVDRVGAADIGIEIDPKFDLRSRNKRSVTIDLKRPDGRDALLLLVEKADVLLEGFRPGVAERLGVGPKDCLVRRPQLVYGRGTGWGQDGPLADVAGHDINYIALTGALDMIGPADGPPVPPLNLIGDYGGGALYLAFGVVCGVLEARNSGRGQVVDAAMVDGVTSLLTMFHALRQAGRLRPGRGRNVLDGGAPYYRPYGTKDGRFVAVGAIEPKFYRELIEKLELDPATLPPQNEEARWPELAARLAERFLTRTRDEWVARFVGSDACFSPVLSLDEASLHPHNAARDSLVELDGAAHPAPAPRLSRTPGGLRSRPPRLGEHTVEVMREWGVAEERVAEGLKSGVFTNAA
jgi:alpha-methylacyl-CoA racemase